MKHLAAIGIIAVFLCGASAVAQRGGTAKTPEKKKSALPAPARPPIQPITVDPVNPHYLRFRGRPRTLVTSGEHFGAVLNSAFDYVKYLDTLHENGMNLARVIDGSYVEATDTSMFPGGDQNTLAPRAGKYLSPWARAEGGTKFDLMQWNEDYFSRLKDFVAEAGKRDIAVEVTLFSTNYGTGQVRWGSWHLNPLNAANNVNGVGEISWDQFNTLENPNVVAAQDALVRRTVTELNSFDNVYYEICNEPYFSGATAKQTKDWENHIVATIQAAEAALPVRHLIARNVADGYAVVTDPNPGVSVYNFHRASPPVAIALNKSLHKPVAFDSTSDGCATLDRRREAWAFLLSGGAVYDSVDQSFTTDDAAGKGAVVNCDGVRYALRGLAEFMAGLDLEHMQPDEDAVRQWPEFSSEIYALDDPGRIYAVYFKGGNNTRVTVVSLDAPAGTYEKQWLNPRTLEMAREDAVDHPGGPLRIVTPEYSEDLALKLIRVADAPPPKVPVQEKGAKPSNPSKRGR